MKKPLVRSKAPELKRLDAALKKTATSPLLRSRPLLGFVKAEPNPVASIKADATQPYKKELDAVGLAFRAASKSIGAYQHHELSGYGSEYFCMIFQDAAQATAFLKGIGYPEPKDVYVDGLVVAELLKVKLPDAQVQPRKLKAIHNPKLTRLAKPL